MPPNLAHLTFGLSVNLGFLTDAFIVVNVVIYCLEKTSLYPIILRIKQFDPGQLDCCNRLEQVDNGSICNLKMLFCF